MAIPRAPFDRLGIVGLGLIGGSIAAGTRHAWPSVRLLGVDAPAIAGAAQRRGLIDEAREEVAALADADLVVLAAPVPEIAALIAEAGAAGLEALVTDVGSTKRRIMVAAEGSSLAFVGGHPIAGAAHAGLDHARANLFVGRRWLLVPPAAGEPDLERLERFVAGLGAIPQRVDAAEHDRAMAYVSHLPQLLANALIRTAGAAVGATGLAVSGAGFADMTRLASSPGDIWRGILETNADFVGEATEAFIDVLRSGGEATGAGVAEAFEQANRWFRAANAGS